MAEEVLASEIQGRAGPTDKTPPAEESVHVSIPKPRGVSEAALEADLPFLTSNIRHVIGELNTNTSEVHGTGRNGRILKEDMHRHKAQKTSPHASVSSQPSEVFFHLITRSCGPLDAYSERHV